MNITRRGFGIGCAAGLAPGLRGTVGSAAPALARGAVAYTPRSFTVGDQPVFLASAEMHYARIPHEHWRDRILKAKRAGMNCVATYVPWNFHEREEGSFRFQGPADLGRYIDLCGELGMYFFARIGPFVSGEWEAGGYPAWLLAKPGAEVRTANTVMRPYIRRWFEQLIPHVAARQVTRGGPVILVQAENEWPYVNRGGGPEYLQWLISLFRELGIEVPVTDCNGLHLKVPNSFKTLNGFNLTNIRQHREEYRGDPIFLSEFYPGWLEAWGWPTLAGYPPMQSTYQQAMAVLAERSQFNYYVFHGGTHFEHWAASTWKSDDAFIATRYYSESPLAEGGVISERYFAAKSGGVIAANFNRFFCDAEPAGVPLETSGPVRAVALRAPQGVLMFVLPKRDTSAGQAYRNDGRGPFLSMVENHPLAEIGSQPGALRLPSGRVVALAEASAFPLALPVGFVVDERCRVDYSNATLFGVAGTPWRRTLLVRGEQGAKGVISVNGREVEFVFRPEPAEVAVSGATVLALSRATADRTWFADGQVVIGPAFVGDGTGGRHECYLDARCSSVRTISAEGEHAVMRVEPPQPALGMLRLEKWTSRPLPEVRGEGEWRTIGTPRPAEELGGYYGYTWYKASIASSAARRTMMYPTRAADRVHVFRGGRRFATWGRGTAATRDPFPIELDAGRNEFVFLCDNMGRSGEGKIAHDLKGILADVAVGVTAHPIENLEWSRVGGPPVEPGWEFATYQQMPPTTQSSFFRVRMRVPKVEGGGALLSLRWVPQYAWIFANGKFAGEHYGDLSLIGGFCSSEIPLDEAAASGPLDLEITFFGEPLNDPNTQIRVFTYLKENVLADWAYKGWTMPEAAGPAEGGPVIWECEFPRLDMAPPFFWVYEGLTKGHAWLNGRSVGNYWHIGPQESLFLPEAWMADRNRLVVLEENGKAPQHTYIIRDPRQPAHKILV